MNIVMIGGSTGIGFGYYKKAILRGDKVVVQTNIESFKNLVHFSMTFDNIQPSNYDKEESSKRY